MSNKEGAASSLPRTFIELNHYAVVVSDDSGTGHRFLWPVNLTRFGVAPTQTTRFEPLRKHLEFYLLSAQSHPSFPTPNPLTRHATFKLERGRAHHSRGPNSFYPGQDTLHVWWC